MLERRSQAHAARGGDALVGRRLWRILKSAGFQQLDLEAVVFHSDELGLEAFSEHFSVDRIAPFFKAGLATQDEVDELRRSLEAFFASPDALIVEILLDRKSTRLNSSHANISYAVFCLKKKKKMITA